MDKTLVTINENKSEKRFAREFLLSIFHSKSFQIVFRASARKFLTLVRFHENYPKAHIQNPVKHIKMEHFPEIVNSF